MLGRSPVPTSPCLFATWLAVSCLPRDADVERERPTAAERQRKAAEQTPSPAPKQHVKKAKPQPTPSPPSRPAQPDPRLAGIFTDNFDRRTLGEHWRATSKVWRIDDGQLCAQGARNHPVWLAKRLPVNARIEFDATSFSKDGDIKAEFWGDGRSAASGVSYEDATSYLTILGGWKNRFHVLARLDEHADDRVELKVDADSEDLRAQPVVPGQRYHFKVVRQNGKLLRWYVDDIEIHTLDDPDPLVGETHEHFGFNDWEVRVCFDNLRVTAL